MRSSPESSVPLPLPSKEEGKRLRKLHLVPPPRTEAPLLEADADEPTLPRVEKTRILPPPPPAARKRSLPPPFKGREAKTLENIQERNVVPAFEVAGFDGLDVAVTLEKKIYNHDSPNRNEDYFIADPKTGLIGVFDGLGGEGKGDLASLSAARALPEAYATALEKTRARSHMEVLSSLVQDQLARKDIKNPSLILKARKALMEMAERILETDPVLLQKASALIDAFDEMNEAAKRTAANPTESNGKTTASVGFVHQAPNGTRWGVIANTGDSGAFKRRADGEVIALTKEDSILNYLRDAGRLSNDLLERMRETPDEQVDGAPASYSDMKRGMTRAIGMDRYAPALSIRQLEKGDELIFATDGLIDVFEKTDDEEGIDLADLDQTISSDASPKEQADELRKETRERNDLKDDDVAVLIARVV